MSISPSPARPLSPPSPDAPLESFRLLALPVELILLVVAHLDDRPSSSSFPPGPPNELLRLSECSRFFVSVCRPKIWAAINYQPFTHTQQPQARLYTRALHQRTRSLAALNEIVQRCAGRVKGDLFGPLPLVRLSILGADQGVHGMDDFWAAMAQEPGLQPAPNVELEEMLEIVASLGASNMLQVLFLQDFMFSDAGAASFLSTILERSPALSAIRFNCVAGLRAPIDPANYALNTNNLRTIQIMHGSKYLVDLTRLAPSLESLLLWPSSRRLGELGEHIAAKMGQLRLLSIDAVHEPAVFKLFADAINDLHAKNEPIALEELFLEGPQVPAERDALIAALAHSDIKRLALYHLRQVTPIIVEDIVRTMPQLEGLTLVQGDTSRAVKWPATLDQYTAQLKKLNKLSFFAFDRKSPENKDAIQKESQMKLEYAALSAVGVACAQLRTAVAVTQDVSEGSSGYFASYTREKGKVRIKMQKKKVKDFLISFDRWCIVAE